MKLYVKIALFLKAIGHSSDWDRMHKNCIDDLVLKYLPQGSGFDSGTKLDFSKSTCNKLVFNTSFHHMDDFGSYAGWTEHRVTIKPSLAFGHIVSVSGRNRNDIKEYIATQFDSAGSIEV